MKFIALMTGLLVSAAAYSQSGGAGATAVLKQVSAKLNSFSSVNYTYVREMKYHADNYHSMDSASMHVEFIPELPIGIRFQAARKESLSVYNGNMTIRLDNKNMTVDSAITPVKSLESNSFLFNSLVSLRNNIPLVIANDSISKRLFDTTVSGKKLVAIYFEGARMYLNNLKGISYVTDPSSRRPYILLIDKKTMLPYQLISKLVRGNDDRDFIKVTYSQIQQPSRNPGRESWDYATYRSTYQPYKRKAPVATIKPGANVPTFKYPVYHPLQNDSMASASLIGKVVLLEFWFKSCGPCLQAMPHYNELQQKFGKDGFELVTINIEDSKKDVGFFFDKYPPTYKMLYNGNQLFESLGFTSCPTSLLVDQQGRAAKTFYGFNQKEIENSIASLLNKK